jgi:hypothetical protein
LATRVDRSTERESIAHRIAWAAVKRTYQKLGHAWVPIEAAPQHPTERILRKPPIA